MILDFRRFIERESPYWDELEARLKAIDAGEDKPSVEEAERWLYLYQRAAADLVRLAVFPFAPEAKARLEALVARSHQEMQQIRPRGVRLNPLRWLRSTLPETFRRRIRAFQLSLAATVAGMLLGICSLWLQPETKPLFLPFSHLHGHPSERVAQEESEAHPAIENNEARFSAQLMTHNIRVSLFILALGMTLGLGTMILLFYNGAILGAVAFDYVRAGETEFLLGWLLPHGSVEIPAILIAGQAGLMLGGALLGWGEAPVWRQRLRALLPDLATLVGGLSILLVWAGLIEAFFSQYHAPVLPYPVKIVFGAVQLAALFYYLLASGDRRKAADPTGVKA